MVRLPAPDRWPQVAALLEEALDLPPESRAAFLDRVCSGDPDLRAELEALVGADAEAGSFLDAPVDLSAFAAPLDPAAGASAEAGPEAASGDARAERGRIGPYRIVREIGRGGMGVVYEAEQQRPRRPVALKVILGGRHADAEAVRLFRRETESLARLKHPGIAAIYESGSTDEGQHFFAMELVPGRTLSDFLAQAGAPESQTEVRRRLHLFRKIAAAVSYAHQRGVIHRDLKPSNILVLEPAGGAPDVKVLDFGLARITDPDAEAPTAVTAIGRIQGTLPYMSPEQVRGRRDEVDVRTDVYSLGVILYRMLSGRPPYELDGREFPEAARIVCEQAPRPLASTGRPARIDRDLAIIVTKALEKDPARRYQGVGALDEDVARFLAGQPILARSPSAAYQIRKLMARHRVPFAAAFALLVLLLGFATAVTLQARRIAAERDRAGREARTASQVSGFLTDLFKVSDPGESRGNAVTAREILDKGVEKIGQELKEEPEVQAGLMLTMGNVYANLGLYKQAVPILEQSVEMRRRLLGEESLDTLAAMSSLAVLYNRLGRAAEAETLHARILDKRRDLQGPDHPDTLNTMSGLAAARRRQARYAEAEDLDRQVVEARRRTLGEDHPDTLRGMFSLAGSLWAQQRYADAEAVYRPTLEKQRRVLGDDHPNTLLTMQNLAGVLRFQGKLPEAESLVREAYERERRVLGEDHPSTLEAMNQLGKLLEAQGRYDDAEPLYRSVLERRLRVLGKEHPETLESMTNLATFDSARGRYAEAGTLLREVLGSARKVLGENHPNTAMTLYNLGCTEALRGNRAGALDWLGQAVAHGWSEGDRMAQDSDLKSLRGDPAFEALAARAGAKPGR
jgi:tetratricopeptide (TPR) repeat protein